MRASLQAGFGFALVALLALPAAREFLQHSLIGHVLVQMPLLTLSGWLLGGALAPRFAGAMQRWNRGGIAGLTLAIVTALFWMLPRSVDSAVQHAGYEAIKFASLPCAGFALALSFRRAHPLLRGVLKANLVSMLAVLAWFYGAAPVRLCNSYLKDDQSTLGLAMALVAGALAMAWSVGLFFGPAWQTRSIFGRTLLEDSSSHAMPRPQQGGKT